MISAKVNLTKLKCIVKTMKSASGEIDCIIIPIAENRMFKSDKGVYLELVAFEIKESKGDDKQTHLVKQSFSKDILEKMSEEEKKALPILGNMIDWSTLNPEAKSESLVGIEEEKDDLPF